MKDFTEWLREYNLKVTSEAKMSNLEIVDKYSVEEMQECWTAAQKKVLEMGFMGRLILSLKLKFGKKNGD